MNYLDKDGDDILQLLTQPIPRPVVKLSDWVIDRSKKRGYKTQKQTKCKECKTNTLVFDNNVTTCTTCGLSSDFVFVEPYSRQPTPYKRLTHFKDWLSKSQAKHLVEFPSGLVDKLKTSGITAYGSIRQQLKKRGLFKHYEDINLLQFLVTGKVYFKLTSSEEELLELKFIEINKVYNRFKVKKRKSIISYSFIIRELISLFFTPSRQQELCLDFFVLPKFEKIQEYRQVFKKIKSHYEW